MMYFLNMLNIQLKSKYLSVRKLVADSVYIQQLRKEYTEITRALWRYAGMRLVFDFSARSQPSELRVFIHNKRQ